LRDILNLAMVLVGFVFGFQGYRSAIRTVSPVRLDW